MSKIKGKYDLGLLYSIHDYYTGKLNQKDINNNILIQYLNNRDIIKNNCEKFSLFIKELLNQIDNNNTIILPFLEPTYDIIDTYINNDFKDKENFEKLLKKLIENSFFNKECLIPIYSYFTELYSEAETISESDDKINKFQKITDLWKLIYINCLNKSKSFSSVSSFCLLGTGFEIKLTKELPDDIYLRIRLNFIKQDLFTHVKNEDLLSYTGGFRYSFKDLKLNIQIVNFVDFEIKQDGLNKIFWISFNGDKTRKISPCIFDNQINIFNNFYGQIKNIIISFHGKDNYQEINDSIIIEPFPLKDNEGIIFKSSYKFKQKIKINPKDKVSDEFNYNIYGNEENNIFELLIKIQNEKLFKANYINSKEDKFDVMNYFGGIIQFLPFLKIINGLHTNKNILLINNEKKGIILINFCKNILLVIFKYILNINTKEQNFLDQYINFFLYIINKLAPFRSKEKEIDITEFIPDNLNRINDSIYLKCIKLFISSTFQHDNKELYSLIQNNYLNVKGNTGRTDNLNIFGKTNSQLYRHILKQLFVYNNLWSKQYLFFKNVNKCYQKYNQKEKKLEIKYKRLNYYTANFQQPLIYPILELDNYQPKFYKFAPEKLYKNKSEKILKYNFSLDKYENCLNERFIKNFLDNDNKEIKIYRCCLIKKMYHVKGKLYCFKNKSIYDNFSIFFLSDKDSDKDSVNDSVNEKCNKKDTNKQDTSSSSNLCYGSMFESMKKEKNRLIVIPRDKIVFVIRRIYYHRLSGLEIFTIDNKSYYFNLQKEILDSFSNKEFKDNIIFFYINKYFQPIKCQDQLLGWYNPKFQNVYYPLFSENIDNWHDRNIYSNFDKLMIINLFSNRSFHDLYQYPVFPMLYDDIGGLKRNMKEPIGFQQINEESKERYNLIKESYEYSKDFAEDEDKNNIHYFNVFFSNITYVCNYLIRVFPYSFIAIEIQGDGFDTPNRLFSSIDSTLHNTLNERADLRELIPEMFYFPPLFYNQNNIQLNKLTDGTEIDNVFIKSEKKFDKKDMYQFIKRMKNYLENEKDLNQWIDLIFGINKEFNDKKERYYDKNNNVEFISKPNVINDELIMQTYDFGVLPLQILSDKFPMQNNISKELEKEINEYNKNQFNQDHFYCLCNEKISFICLGEKGINSKYLDLINKSQKGKKFLGIEIKWNFFNKLKNYKPNDNIYYLFTGDSFGNLAVYDILKKTTFPESNNDFEIIDKEKKYSEMIENNQYRLLKKICAHTKEIKYIDYNPRLNLLADYSLDGFINIYTMPRLKLVRVIQTKDFNILSKINKIALISNPFPMICCATKAYIIIFDINGEFIKQYNIDKKCKVEFCVDKNLGIFNDFVIYTKSNESKNVELP